MYLYIFIDLIDCFPFYLQGDSIPYFFEKLDVIGTMVSHHSDHTNVQY